MKGVWFGQPPRASRRNDLLTASRSAEIARDRALAALELLKLGEFSAKVDLLDAMYGAEPDLRSACCAAFCSVAEHRDIAQLMEVLDETNQEDVEAFALYSVDTLSAQTVPYLLALAEVWEGTQLEQDLHDALQTLFPANGEERTTLAEVRDLYRGLGNRIDPAAYYLWGKPAFPGDLTRELIRAAGQAKHERRALEMFEVPMFLSVWSGVECPVSYASTIDEATFGTILTYTEHLASMKWRKGAKYFYGNCVG